MPNIQVNGVSLHFSRSGRGTPLLLLHELGGSTRSWQHIEPWCAAQHETICLDLRGAGRSEKHGPYDFPTLMFDLEGFVASLGLGDMHVVGCAMTSMLLFACASKDRIPFRSMTLCSVGPGLTDQGRGYLRDRAKRVVPNGMASVFEESTRNSFPQGFAAPYGATMANYRAAFLANDPSAYSGHSLGLCAYDFEAISISRLAYPAQVLSGANDYLWPPEDGRRVADKLGSAEMHVIDDAAHFPPLQNPAAFASHLLAFTARVDHDRQS